MRASDWFQRKLDSKFGAKGHIDHIANNRVAGWAFSKSGPVRVEAKIRNEVIASVVPAADRPDVGLAYPGLTRARHSGFALTLPAAVMEEFDLVDVDIEVRSLSSLSSVTQLTRFTVAGSQTVKMLIDAPASGIVGPFPQKVIDGVSALWPDDQIDFESVEGQRAFVGRLRTIVRTAELRAVPAIADYARYLQSIWAHFKFVEKYFPSSNETAKPESADFHCKPNSVFEILAIAHQLYVLKSYEITGDFAEFGCFKGFSSAMLSHACQLLGLKMHIFDSFEGLPPSDRDGYAAGDYAGSLDEVTENVRRYGEVSVVEFHKGFFSDTFSRYRPPPLMCLWMDVDLEVSAQDLMVVADVLNPRSTLFSHECTAEIFVDGSIQAERNPDNPIPPILDRFEQLGRPLTGRFIRGNTGAFWPVEGGVPAVDNTVLMELIHEVL